MSYTAKVISGDGGKVRYIKAKEAGKAAWYLLELFPEFYTDYKKQIRAGDLSLTAFGKVLASGWGAEAPAAVLKQYNIH